MGVNKRDYKIAVGSLWILTGLFIVFTFLGFFYRPKVQYEYGVVVDISSYDIEFNLYRWENKERIKNMAKVLKMYTISCDINIHIKGFTYERLREKMYRCMSDVISHIENYEIYNSTFFVYGTELTRLMCKNEYDKCARIFSVVVDVLTSFDMRLSVLNARVLKGYQEALYGWIGVNDYFDLLQKNKNFYGGLDMKNYSLLISYMDPTIEHGFEHQNTSVYELYGKKFHLRGIDMMCYGLIQAYNRLNLYLISNMGLFGGISNPCLKKNYQNEILLSDIITPCSKYSGSKTKVTINGDWNLKSCTDLVSYTLEEFDKEETLNIKAIKSKFNLINKTFFGFSRISEIASLIEYKGKNFKNLYDYTINLCNSNNNLKYNYACFDIIYLNELLVKKLNINGEDIIIGYKEKIETVTGSMIYNTKGLDVRKGGRIMGFYGILLMLFSVLLFSILALYMTAKTIIISTQDKF